MSEFEEALRGTMSHPNRPFEQADADLLRRDPRRLGWD